MTDTPPVQTAQPTGSNSSAVAALVLGICSIVFSIGCVIGLVCGIIGVAQAKKSDQLIAARLAPESSRGLATAGRVCSWIGIALSSLMVLFWIVYAVIAVVAISAAGIAASQQHTGPDDAAAEIETAPVHESH